MTAYALRQIVDDPRRARRTAPGLRDRSGLFLKLVDGANAAKGDSARFLVDISAVQGGERRGLRRRRLCHLLSEPSENGLGEIDPPMDREHVAPLDGLQKGLGELGPLAGPFGPRIRLSLASFDALATVS